MTRAFASLVFGFGVLVALVSPIGQEATAATDVPPRVELVSAGKSPRSTLRIAVSDGTQAQATMQMSQSIRQSMGGQQISAVDTPPITVRMHTLAGTPSPTGSTPITYGYSDIGVVSDGSLTEEQVAQYQAALAPLESLAGAGTLTPRNEFVDSELSGVQEQDPSVAQILSQLEDQLSTLTAPFPREAVGVGAQWRVTARLRLSGIDVRQTTQYSLREREGSRAVFDVEVTQTAARQRAELPGLPDGAKVEITKWKMSGTGSVTLSLVQPVLPLSSQMHLAGTQLLAVTAQGEHGTLVQKIAIDAAISP